MTNKEKFESARLRVIAAEKNWNDQATIKKANQALIRARNRMWREEMGIQTDAEKIKEAR